MKLSDRMEQFENKLVVAGTITGALVGGGIGAVTGIVATTPVTVARWAVQAGEAVARRRRKIHAEDEHGNVIDAEIV